MIGQQRILDKYLGAILCHLFHYFKPSMRTQQPEKILIIKLWAIGESVLTLPLIRQVHKYYPQATIDVLARDRNHQVYCHQPYISHVYTLEHDTGIFLKKMRNYDCCFDLEPYMNISALFGFLLSKNIIGFSHGTRSSLYSSTIDYNDRQHVVLTYLDLLKPLGLTPSVPKKLDRLHYHENDREKVKELKRNIESNQNELTIAICPGAAESCRARIWPPINYASVINQILDTYPTTIFLIGDEQNNQINQEILTHVKHPDNVINTAGKMSLSELFSFLDQGIDLFISNDTGPMHIAAAQQIPTIGLFCPNTPVRFAPYGPSNISIYKPVFTEPCIQVHKGIIPDCSTHQHMKNIKVEDVISAVQTILKE